MKAQNVLTNALLCVALTAAPIFSSFAKDGDGGLSGGGGGTSAELNQIATSFEVDLALKNIKLLTIMRVNSFQSMFYEAYEPAKQWVDINHYFYPNANKLLSTIKSVKISVQTEACKHPTEPGKNLEGAAYPEQNLICLSSGQILAKRHTRGQIANKIIGLFSHEIFHIMNPSVSQATHDSALSFQLRLESHQSDEADTFKILTTYEYQRGDAIDMLTEARNSIEENNKRFDLTGLCTTSVTLSHQSTDARFDEFDTRYNGYAVNGRKMSALNEVIKYKLLNLASVCYKDGALPVYASGHRKYRIAMASMFEPGTQSRPLVEYAGKLMRVLFIAEEMPEPLSEKEMQQSLNMVLSRIKYEKFEQINMRQLFRNKTDEIKVESAETLVFLNQYLAELNTLPAPVGLE